MHAAHGGASLLARLNGAAGAAEAHVAFCAAYLGADVSEAHLIGVDRTGFTLLGRAPHVQDGAWREFRFAFSQEVTDEDTLRTTLDDMAAEAMTHLAGDAGGGA